MITAFKEVVTVADVLDAGACIEGVVEFVKENGGVIAGRAADYPGNKWIQSAAAANAGNGYGDGYGYGNGYGNGNGYGYGYGDGGVS